METYFADMAMILTRQTQASCCVRFDNTGALVLVLNPPSDSSVLHIAKATRVLNSQAGITAFLDSIVDSTFSHNQSTCMLLEIRVGSRA